MSKISELLKKFDEVKSDKEAKSLLGKDSAKASKKMKSVVKDLNKKGLIVSLGTEDTLDFFVKGKLDKGFEEITFQEDDGSDFIVFLASGSRDDDLEWDSENEGIDTLARWLKSLIK